MFQRKYKSQVPRLIRHLLPTKCSVWPGPFNGRDRVDGRSRNSYSRNGTVLLIPYHTISITASTIQPLLFVSNVSRRYFVVFWNEKNRPYIYILERLDKNIRVERSSHCWPATSFVTKFANIPILGVILRRYLILGWCNVRCLRRWKRISLPLPDSLYRSRFFRHSVRADLWCSTFFAFVALLTSSTFVVSYTVRWLL